MKMLVTGGSGFIGSNFIEYQLNNYSDVEIVNVDKLTYAGNMCNNDAVKDDKRYRHYRYDIRDLNAMHYVFSTQQPDYVINFAAESHVDNSLNDGKSFVDTNVGGTLTLLEATKKNGRVRKFVQISTDEVYGSIAVGSTDEHARYNPRNPYAASKAAAEHFVNAYVESFGLNAVITRCTNNYGRYQHAEKFIPNAIKRIVAENSPIAVYGNGTQVREWTHVSDHCRGIDLVTRADFDFNGSYNIPGGFEISNYELARMICTRLNVEPDDYIKFVQDRPGHDQRYSLTSKYYHHLGDSKFNIKSFKTGLDETVEWYKNQFLRGQTYH
jgi:dTDP-glucose 4,6-dehydratase